MRAGRPALPPGSPMSDLHHLPKLPHDDCSESKCVRIFRRPEADLIREGKLILQHGRDYYDLTEYRWQREMPLNLTTMCARGALDPDPLERWLEDGDLPRTHAILPEDRLISPILPREVGKILALGKNFRAHAEEFGEEPPSEPLFFNKLCETITGHNAIVSPPAGYTGRLDHEVELALLISRRAIDVDERCAMDYVGGYTIANDLTLRTTQSEDRDRRYPWFRSKNFIGACPLGPGFAPACELNGAALEITASVNGELRQRANTRDMLTSIPAAVAYLSRHIPLFPGDLILMGTPAGVGPLEDGDVVTCAIEGLGELTTHIRRA